MAPQCCNYVWGGMSRRKHLQKDVLTTPLKRCLSWWHLTFFGVGQMAGAGVYVLTGAVAVTTSGPATFISYIIAGFCAFLSALAYAEFGARCPKAGSAYTYAYITVGEFIGFAIGWNLLLEHCIGAASTARAWGGAINALSSNAIKNWTLTNIGSFNLFGFAEYPDFFALVIVIILTLIVIYGAKESMTLNVVVAVVNVVATVFIASLGFYLARPENMTRPDGFTPFGWTGVLSGAAMCYYAYVGYDGIAMAGEEAENPKTALPLANALSMSVVMVMYVLMSTSLTLTVPYNQIDDSAPFAFAFAARGWDWAAIAVTLASLVAITGTTLGNIFAVPRCAYSMASDGLLFRCLAYVHPSTQTPIYAIIAFSTISGLCAFILDLETLAEMVSLGTLMAAFFVSGCVIILRYEPKNLNPFNEETAENDLTGTLKPKFANLPYISKFNPGRVAKWCVLIMGTCLMTVAAIFLRDEQGLDSGDWWAWLIGSMAAVVALLALLVIVLHVQNDTFDAYKMPLAPFLPSLSMFTIACLMTRLSPMAWLRFLIWMLAGLGIYFGYGIRHSSENRQPLLDQDNNSYHTISDQTETKTESETKAGTSPL